MAGMLPATANRSAASRRPDRSPSRTRNDGNSIGTNYKPEETAHDEEIKANRRISELKDRGIYDDVMTGFRCTQQRFQDDIHMMNSMLGAKLNSIINYDARQQYISSMIEKGKSDEGCIKSAVKKLLGYGKSQASDVKVKFAGGRRSKKHKKSKKRRKHRKHNKSRKY